MGFRICIGQKFVICHPWPQNQTSLISINRIRHESGTSPRLFFSRRRSWRQLCLQPHLFRWWRRRSCRHRRLYGYRQSFHTWQVTFRTSAAFLSSRPAFCFRRFLRSTPLWPNLLVFCLLSLFGWANSENCSFPDFVFFGLTEVSGPPEFLNNSVEEYAAPKDIDQPRGGHGGRRNRKEKKDLPTGMVSVPDLVWTLLLWVSLGCQEVEGN